MPPPIRSTLAVERALELGVGTIERFVVPVEAAARLGGRDEQTDEDGAEERLVLRRPRPGVGTGEDGCGRFALQLLERDQRIVASAKPRCALLDERPHERPVLVQRRPPAVLVLHEGDRQLGALVELAEQIGERAEHEPAEGVLEMRSANGHGFGYAPAARIPVCGRLARHRPECFLQALSTSWRSWSISFRFPWICFERSSSSLTPSQLPVREERPGGGCTWHTPR